MSYDRKANRATPALVIYLLDVSGSMGDRIGNARKIDIVFGAFHDTLVRMVARSTKGGVVSPRYRIGLFAYTDEVYDLLDGVKSVDYVAKIGATPHVSPQKTTDTARAFRTAKAVLAQQLALLPAGAPAPLVCHMTDGEYTGADPTPVAREIMAMSVPDGNVLVQNVYISGKVVQHAIGDPFAWQGINARTPLASKYAETLRSISSPLPQTYRQMMLEEGYRIDPDALMLLPGTTPELVAMAFSMSSSTPIVR